MATSTNATISIDPDEIPYIEYMHEMERIRMDVVNIVTYVTYIIGISANLLLLVCLIKFKRYLSPTFMLITNLCICDIGTCFTAIVLPAVTVPVLIRPEWACGICGCLADYFYCCSVFHLVFFSILRFYQLVFLLSARARITSSLVAKICITIWITAAGLVLLVLTFYKAVPFHYNRQLYMVCDVDMDNIENLIITVALYILLPDIVIAGFHSAKHYLVKKQAKVMSDQQNKKQRQTTDSRAVTIVIVVFWITSIPYMVHTYIHYLFNLPAQSYHLVLVIISNSLAYGNSVFNPFIYVISAATIRHDITIMMKCA